MKCIKRCLVLLLALCTLCPVGCGVDHAPRSAVAVEDCGPLLCDGAGVTITNDNKIEEYRSRYGLGTCHTLSGEQTVVLFFVDDAESYWTEAEVRDFTELRVIPALEFLSEQAAIWGIELSFTVKRYSTPLSEGLSLLYDGEVIQDFNRYGSTKDLPEQCAAIFGFENEIDFLAALTEEHGNENLIPLMLLSKDGTAIARPQLSEQIVDHMEHAILFTDRLTERENSWRYSRSRIATIAHEILHLFGAEDYYLTEGRLSLAERYYPDDIMLLDTYDVSVLKIREMTAYAIGWSEEVPELCYEAEWYE